MKIGVFGGAFNPVHNGHINLAQNYYDTLMLDKLLFVPTAVPPHKTSDDLASEKARLDMLNIALKDKPYFEVTDIEFKRSGKSYTYDTLCRLLQMYNGAQLYLIIGADQFLSFDKWYRWSDILNMVNICTCARENESEKKKIIDFSNRLKGLDENRFFLLDAPVLKLSSSEIRDKIKKGENASALLPDGVYNYICTKGLYDV